MPGNLELYEQAENLRILETIGGPIGSMAFGIGVFATALTAANLARTGNVNDAAAILGSGGLVIGPGLLSLTGSWGRRADAIDSELLARNYSTDQLPPPPIPPIGPED